MKQLPLLFTLMTMLLCTGCLPDRVVRKYTFYRPVYKTSEAARAEIRSSEPVTLSQPGKIYYKDGFVFLNELQKGVHIIDIRNPAQPKSVSFVKIPGCVDMAVRGNILYADMFTDLVALDISNPLDIKRTHIIEGVFPENYYNGYLVKQGEVITDWVRVDTTVLEMDYFTFGPMKAENNPLMLRTDAGGATNGIGGSMARFALNKDRLYTVSHSDLKVFNAAIPERPAFIKTMNIGWNIETIFPYNNHLFVGSMTGMYIFDATDKDNPIQKSRFEHARVCDPVIADDNIAYVTLRNGTECAGFINQLDVLDITDVSRPVKIKSYDMTNPHGLSKDGNILMICEGKEGLRFLDAARADKITNISLLKGMNTFDVIALGNGTAIVTAEDGLYIISYADPANPKVMASIRINL